MLINIRNLLIYLFLKSRKSHAGSNFVRLKSIIRRRTFHGVLSLMKVNNFTPVLNPSLGAGLIMTLNKKKSIKMGPSVMRNDT